MEGLVGHMFQAEEVACVTVPAPITYLKTQRSQWLRDMKEGEGEELLMVTPIVTYDLIDCFLYLLHNKPNL